MRNQEYILCAAIWWNDGKIYDHQPKNIEEGFVVCGRRHHNCFMTVYIVRGKKFKSIDGYKEVQGFLTNTDRFVDRKEAYKIVYPDAITVQDLYSEDLY